MPRAAVLPDQEGDYVFVVGEDNKAERAAIQLGQSTPTMALDARAACSGGEKVIVEGLQRVRPASRSRRGPASAPQPVRAAGGAARDRPAQRP